MSAILAIGSRMDIPKCVDSMWFLSEGDISYFLTPVDDVGDDADVHDMFNILSPLGEVLVELLNSWVDWFSKSCPHLQSNLFPTQSKSDHIDVNDFSLMRKALQFKSLFLIQPKNNEHFKNLSLPFKMLNLSLDPSVDSICLKLLLNMPDTIDTIDYDVFVLTEKFTETLRKMASILIQSRSDVCIEFSNMLMEDKNRIDRTEFWWKVKCCLQGQDQYPDDETFDKFLRSFEDFLCEKLGEILENDEDIERLKCINLILKKSPRPNLFKEVIELFTVYMVDFDETSVDMLLSGLHHCDDKKNVKCDSENVDSGNPTSRILKICFTELIAMLKKTSTRSSTFEDKIISLALEAAEGHGEIKVGPLLKLWEPFVKMSLKFLYKKPNVHKLLSLLVPTIYSQSQTKVHLTAHMMFQMTISHTAFLDTLLSETSESTAKDGLVNLIYELCKIEPDCFEINLANSLTGAYSPTLSVTNQRLLYLIEHFSKAKTNQSFECPTLWGKPSLDQRKVSELLGSSLDRQVPVKNILEQINPKLMQDSLLHFPVIRLMDSRDQAVTEAHNLKSKSNIYDPRFMLKLFAQILSEDKIVPVRMFVEKDCLSYLMISLSSHDMETRLVAYQCLNRFYHHLEGSRCQEKMELTFVLDLFNASRTKHGQKVTSVIALFFAKVVKLVLFPADHMYVPMFRFFMAKAQVDLNSVPEFYQLFFSATQQLKSEKYWILTLLWEGMRETSDYNLIQKHYIFKIVMAFYTSALSDLQSRLLILKMIWYACRVKVASVDLVKNHGLLTWLSGVIETIGESPEEANIVSNILHSLWFTLIYDHKKLDPQLKGTKGKSEKEKEDENVTSEDDEMDNTEETQSPVQVQSSSIPQATLYEIHFLVKRFLLHMQKLPSSGVNKMLQLITSVMKYQSDRTPTCKDQMSYCHFTMTEKESFQLAIAVCKSVGDHVLVKDIETVMRQRGLLESISSDSFINNPGLKSSESHEAVDDSALIISTTEKIDEKEDDLESDDEDTEASLSVSQVRELFFNILESSQALSNMLKKVV